MQAAEGFDVRWKEGEEEGRWGKRREGERMDGWKRRKRRLGEEEEDEEGRGDKRKKLRLREEESVDVKEKREGRKYKMNGKMGR